MNRSKLLGFALGPAGTGLVAVVTIPLLTWWYDAADIGKLYLLQSLVSIVVIIISLGLDQAYVREYHEIDREGKLLAAVLPPVFALLIAGCLFAALGAPWISAFLTGTSDPQYTWVFLLCLVAAVVLRFSSLILRMHEWAFSFSFSQILPKILFLLLAVGTVLLVSRPGFIELETAQAISLLLAATFTVWLVRISMRDAWISWRQRAPLAPMLRYAAPLAASALLYTGLLAVGAFSLRALSSFEQVGLYSVALSVAGVASVVQATFSIVWAPIVYRWVAAGVDPDRVNAVSQQILSIVVAAFALVGSLSWVVGIVLPTTYQPVAYLVLCAIVQPLLYTLAESTGIGVMIRRRTILALAASGAALLVAVMLCWWLVPPLGAAGAVIANAVSFLVFYLLKTEFSAHVWASFPRARMHLVVSTLIVLAILTTLFAGTIGWAAPVAWVIVGLVGLIIFRKSYRSLMGSLLGRGKGHQSGGA